MRQNKPFEHYLYKLYCLVAVLFLAGAFFGVMAAMFETLMHRYITHGLYRIILFVLQEKINQCIFLSLKILTPLIAGIYFLNQIVHLKILDLKPLKYIISLYRQFPKAYFRYIFPILLVALFEGNFVISKYRNIILTDKPNILLVSIDTLRADRLSAYGHYNDTSDVIDQLALRGVLFENAYSTSPKTTPAHMSMMTSLNPNVHGIFMVPSPKARGARLARSIPTLAEVLRNEGYETTALTGGGGVHSSHGFDQGFESYANTGNFYRTTKWLRKNYQKKFFLFFHTYAVHDPYISPTPYNRLYYPGYKGNVFDTDEEIAKWQAEDGWNAKHDIYWESVDKNNPDDIKFLKSMYDGCIKYVDNQRMSKIIRILGKKRILDNTIIIVTSDHGEALADRDNFLHEDLHKETVHIPFIIYYPKAIEGNIRIKNLVRITDIMPTVLGLAGIKTDIPFQGTDLTPMIKGEEDIRQVNYGVYTDDLSIRTDDMAAIFRRNENNAYICKFLYDRKKDPLELKNIVGKNREKLDLAYKLLRRMQDDDARMNAYEHIDLEYARTNKEAIKQLKALGYL